MTDVALILLLILVNGAFALSEMAVVSSRQAKLQALAAEGHPGTASALQLHNEPSKFLSTVQIGVTTIAILNGAIGGTALARPLGDWLGGYALLTRHSDGIALAIVVGVITYLSVVIGELVPKRLALLRPESIATAVARPMTWLSRAAKPLVWLLAASSGLIVRLLRAAPGEEPPVTDEEIEVLMEQGAEAGVFHVSEQAIVSNVLRLDEQRVGAIMTPRKDIYYIDLDDSAEENKRKMIDAPHSRVIVCAGGLEHILGILDTADYLRRSLKGEPPVLAESLPAPLYVPDSVSATQLMESLREARSHLALIVDEYGELQGLVTVDDLFTAIVGEIPSRESAADSDIVKRENGSWLIDGALSVERFKDLFDLAELPDEGKGLYNTVGGFVTVRLRRIPRKADHFSFAGLRIEVVDMDRHRVSELLVSRLPADAEAVGAGPGERQTEQHG